MQLPALVEAGYRVAALDARGSGESSAPQGPYTIAQLADDAAALMAHLGWSEARMMGLSQGGFVVEELMAQRPELVHQDAGFGRLRHAFLLVLILAFIFLRGRPAGEIGV